MPDNKQLIEQLRADTAELREVDGLKVLPARLDKVADTIERLEAELQALQVDLKEHKRAAHLKITEMQQEIEERDAALQHAQEQVGESDGD